MAEEALCVLGCDGVERRPERLMQGVGGAGCDLAQPPLHLGPNWLDWVQIRRVIPASAKADLLWGFRSGRECGGVGWTTTNGERLRWRRRWDCATITVRALCAAWRARRGTVRRHDA